MTRRLIITCLFIGFLSPAFAANETQRISILEREVSLLREKVREINEKVVSFGGLAISTKSSSSHSSAIYTIRSGDSLWQIARRNGTSVSKIESLNPGLNPSCLRIGASIRIPETTSSTSRSTQQSSGQASNYSIKLGDTLGAIASRSGMRLSELLRVNPGVHPDRIRIGQRIVVPGGLQSFTAKTTSRKPVPQRTISPTPPRMVPKPPRIIAAQEVPRRPQLIVVSENRRLDEIARFYSTDILTINKLNQVTLSPSQMIQRGSQIYVPKQ
ncbi:LysM peptidoglycan-binding domain-containing protein [Akkermansiaceae bacterium]|nr:LysM peptidoglycan-binding domain-containing protein [Akkermansiaceae bacterium]